ncbi:MAG: glycosyltransferase family 2 protein [Clostridia bacterium]|nr:glycosyltransferase family 2 protein [Clostridia bacterium]
MKNPIVSIIMPVYGVEKYLDRSIQSVLNQTYSDFELILVDDRSPDNCPAICDDYSKKDDRIKVIHKEINEGLGEARNTGITYAEGKYILFMDSDDYIDENLLDSVLACTEETTDITVFGIRRVYEDVNGETDYTEELLPKNSFYDKDSLSDAFIELNKSKAFPFAWNKLYKRSFLDYCDKKFERTKLIEDFLFNIAIFSKANRIKTLDKAFYNYRKPAHETLASAYSPDFFDLCKRKYLLEEEYLIKTKGDSPENLQFISESYIKHLISVFIKNSSKKASLSVKEQKQLIYSVLSDELTVNVLAKYNCSDLKYKLICGIFRRKNIFLCYILTKSVQLMQTKFKRVLKKVF